MRWFDEWAMVKAGQERTQCKHHPRLSHAGHVLLGVALDMVPHAVVHAIRGIPAAPVHVRLDHPRAVGELAQPSM